MILETKRLILRHWEENDAADLYEYARDPRVGPAAGWPVHTSVENSREIIRTSFAGKEIYAVVLKETGKAVGCIGVEIDKEGNSQSKPGEAEIGYWIGVPYWGRGLIPEAVEELLRRCFEDMGCPVVWAGYYDGNDKSRRVMEKCGFRYHHTQKDQPVPLLGEVRDAHYTRITRAEWELPKG